MTTVIDLAQLPQRGLDHDALLFDGQRDLVARVVPFVTEGLALGEPVLVALPTEHLGPVRSAMGTDARRVEWLDLRGIGTNPSRIIPAWVAFVDQHRASGRRLRGVGEPIWAGRSADEVVECQLHEQLLNLGFPEARSWTLLCPYDVTTLAPEVIAAARQSHVGIQRHGHHEPSASYRTPRAHELPGEPLSPVPDAAERVDFAAHNLADVRDLTREMGDGVLEPARALDQCTAVHEIAANSVRHGGGTGTARAWVAAGSVVVQVDDRGHITDPLAGRCRPHLDAQGGRGLWMANQLCDLVQLRSGPGGTKVRLHQHPG